MPRLPISRALLNVVLGSALGLAAFALVPAKPAGATPDPDQPRFYLSFGAPYGMPGASASFAPSCGDSTHRDTLYLSFEPSMDESTFVGVGGEVYIYAQPGDTLGQYWDISQGGANHGGLIAQFGPDSSFPGVQPWPSIPIAVGGYDRTRGSGRFRFLCTLAPAAARPVQAGKRYVLGRIILAGKRANLSGCASPVCIEWRRAQFVFSLDRELDLLHGGVHTVTRGEAGSACRDRIPGWRPPGMPSSGGVLTPEPKPN